jgi:hypothetical protein
MGAAAVAAIMRRREREVVDDFRTAGAVSRETAQSYTAVGLGESLGLKRLRERAVIRDAAPDGDHQDVNCAVAIQSGRSIFRQGIMHGAASYAVAGVESSGTKCPTS